MRLALLRCMVVHVDRGLEEFRAFVEGGAQKVKSGVPRYRSASKHVPHVVLTDLDDHICPSAMLAEWSINGSPPTLLFRIAVREAESWVLADAPGFASFAGILTKQVPARPEELSDPKQTLVNLTRRSKNRRTRLEMVPPTGSAVPIGPLYNERLSRFVAEQWDPDRASAAAPSLARALLRLRTF